MSSQTLDSSRICIRRGQTEDAAGLSLFGARTFEQTYGSENRPEDMAAHLSNAFGVAQQTAELTDPGWVTLLAELDGELLAFAQVRWKKPPACVDRENVVELHRFYVDRPAHGRGVAQRLMTEVFEAARELGGHHLWLSVWEKNPRAIAFYKKEGFADLGPTVFVVGGDRQTDRVLVADLGIDVGVEA